MGHDRTTPRRRRTFTPTVEPASGDQEGVVLPNGQRREHAAVARRNRQSGDLVAVALQADGAAEPRVAAPGVGLGGRGIIKKKIEDRQLVSPELGDHGVAAQRADGGALDVDVHVAREQIIDAVGALDDLLVVQLDVLLE